MSLHLKRAASGHLYHGPSDHLISRIASYSVVSSSGYEYRGEASGHETAPDGTPDMEAYAASKIGGYYAAAISAMSYYTSGVSDALRSYGYIPGFGWEFDLSARISASVMIIGIGVDGPTFGAPKGDVSIESTGSGYAVYGTGSSAPTGNPRNISGEQFTSSTTLYGETLGQYVWVAAWFFSPTAGGLSVLSQKSRLSITNLRAN